ncbi:MAG: hypothetical protein L6R40_000306 [Gallowayella cf. fulva]|nr:MAG: hypothetical protein L6R40_000306 [Xanthomendoza cf. fulva]
MPDSRSALVLSNELLKDVLDCIDADPERTVNIDRRAYLSVESFRPPSLPEPSRAHDIGNFRLVCRRFAEAGIPYQFTKIATRFSRHGLERLDKICSQHHLAKHTRKFSYLVPYFYVEGREQIERLLESEGRYRDLLDPSFFRTKADDQRHILQTKEDARILGKAMTAFVSLQHVQILRLQDEADRILLDMMEEQEISRAAMLDLKWTPACIHATSTIAQALLHTRSPFSRFSGPMMNSQSALVIKDRIPPTVSLLASRLTCLELHFDDSEALNERMRAASQLFRTVFMAAKNLQAVHVGFPSRSPLNLKLEEIFHCVHWEKLRAFGIQAWRLEADEIIQLARRHSGTLRGLRLRDVQLREGSMWKDVLAMLRNEMEQLDWVSLRRVDYTKHFDELWANSMEVMDGSLGGSESDDDDDFPAHFSVQGSDQQSEDGFDSEDGHSLADTDQGPDANEIALSPNTTASLPFCTCSRSSDPASADELGDNGMFVFYQQRKMWEQWVIGRCPEHSST